MVVGKFVSLDAGTLQTMLTQWQACLSAIASYDEAKGTATAIQSYSMAGRTFTRADLPAVSDMVAEISYALKLNSGGLVRTVYSDFSR